MGHRPRRRLPGLLVAALAFVVVAAGAVDPASAGPTSRRDHVGSKAVPVIVQARMGHRQEAAVAVRAAGGQLGRSLPIVEGFAARLPASVVHRLAADPAIRSITPDGQVHFSMADSSAESDVGSAYPKSTGATAAWALGQRGAGIGVAVIDTGIAQVPDLAGRVVAGPDFSGEHDSLLDSYGHGTVMAGVIAGDGANSSSRAGGAYVGMAPAARLVSVKVAGRNGATDVSTVLAAMQWVGSHKSQHNIRVVNLSWGTTSDQSPSIDPLNYAVQRLWRAGIVVVAAAGNDGPTSGTITKPGDDPVIITAGAYNDRHNASRLDDVVPAWSSRGPTAAGVAKPDVVAPGRTLIATRAPGSAIEQDNPRALIGAGYIRGSGTSQASAVVAGAVALLLGRRSGLQPDEVKHAIVSGAVPIAGSRLAGRGRLSVANALSARVRNAPVQALISNGLGSLEASRGGRHVQTMCGADTTPTRIQGEIDALCQLWNGESWTGESWSADSWSADSWSGESWTGESWTGDSWTGESWTGTSFLTAFWGDQTPWWQRLPGEQSAARTATSPAQPGAGE